MPTNSVFIGLVSHTKTTFPQSLGPAGLTAKLAEGFSELGVSVHVQINTANYFDESEFQLTPSMSRASVLAEIRVEKDWARFHHRRDKWRQRIRIAGRYLYFMLRWRSHSNVRELRRLLNIEYSHVDLYRNAIESGADWIIILEDDAHAVNSESLAPEVFNLLNTTYNVKIINLSTSFELDKIGLTHSLTPVAVDAFDRTEGQRVFASSRPATNTVCAVAFRKDFLELILKDFDSHAKGPVIPIDWKLNASLMRLWDSGSIGVNECWFVEPSPILQLSMHSHN